MTADKKMTPQEAYQAKQRRAIKKLKRQTSDKLETSMTSMIDVVFLLIFFFMVVTDLSNMEIESVALPYAMKAVEDEKDDIERVIVNVTDEGAIRLMRREFTLDDLEAELKERTKRVPVDGDNLPIIGVKIRADSNTEYKYVQQIIARCMKAFIWRVSFGAQPESGDSLDL